MKRKYLDLDNFVCNAHPDVKDMLSKELEIANTIKSKKVIEIGCGTGRILEALAENCSYVVGIDNQKSMVYKTRERTKHLENVSVSLDEAEKILFPSNLFDFVICFGNTFGNWSNKKEITILKEMKRVCKSEGRILISVYNERALNQRLESYENDELTQIKITKEGTVHTKEGLFSKQFTKKDLNKIFDKIDLNYNIVDLNKISYLCICQKKPAIDYQKI